MTVYVSVIVPVYNEENSLPLFYEELIGPLEKTNKTFEVIFIDDGSTDGSFKVLEDLRAKDPHLRIVKLDRNYGQHPALAAGFELAKGEVIVIMDADRQNDPADIPRLIEKTEEGYSMVWGWRETRHDPLFTRKIPSYIFNKMICKIIGVKLKDINCGIKAFKRPIVQIINRYGEQRNFLPVFLAKVSPSIAEIPVNHRRREHGKSKYNFLKSCEIIFSFLTSYSLKTFRLAGIMGLFGTIGGCGLSVLYVFLYYSANVRVPQIGTILAVTIIVGVQFFVIGMIGELINRIYRISDNRPLFVIEKILE